MKKLHSSRLCLGASLLVSCVAAPVFARQPKPPAPVVTKPARAETPRAGVRAAANQQHLQQWMETHKSLSLHDQQRALENEPGFHELPAQVQQRYREQLLRLYNMNPQQRSRMLDRNEALERLTPDQRQQWRGAVQQLNALSLPRRRLMARAILDLREMSPEQREQTIAAPAFAGQFSDSERSTIRTLLTAEPYPVVHASNEAP